MIVRNKIFLRKKRDFGEMFGTVFTLTRRNFGVLCGSVLVTGGPFILFAVVTDAFMRSNVLGSRVDFMQSFMKDPSQYLSDMISQHLHWFLIMMAINLLPFAFIRSAVANFFVVYERKNEGENLAINEITSRAFKDGLRLYSASLVFTLIAIVAASIIGLPMFMLGTVGNGAGVVLVIFILFFSLLAFGPQLMYIFNYATWFSMVRDKVFLFKAIGNVFKTIGGNFWWTWVLMICMILITMLLAMVVNIPMMIYGAVSGFSRFNETFEFSFAYVAIMATTQILSQLIFCLLDVMTGVSYYSFEEEKTGAGLTMRIDEIGKQEENPNYR